MSDDTQAPGPFDIDETRRINQRLGQLGRPEVIERRIERVAPMPKRKRRTKAEIEAARAAEASPVKHFPTISECRASMGR